MNWGHEAMKMAVPARHHARHASKARRAGRGPARLVPQAGSRLRGPPLADS